MKSLITIVLISFISIATSFSQILESDISDLRKGIAKKKISLQLNGESISFSLSENQTLSRELKNVHPTILSYNLLELDGSKKGKLTIADGLVTAHIKDGAELTTLTLEENSSNYAVSTSAQKPQCGTEDSPRFFGQNHIVSAPAQRSADDLSYGETLRTYRLAIVGTGEFTENNGGTSASAMAVATSSVNGINLIFENESSITMTLVASQFYTDSGTDPFTPDGAGGDSRTNQAAEVIASNFSESSYDIGHVFHYYTFGGSWGAGGIAGLGVVCDNGTFFSTSGDSDGITGANKGAGWSGSFNNTDNSWIQLSAHEFGHQFDATHTFNGGGNSNCNFGISSSTAYEIGSGTSIMSYSGLCSADQNVPESGVADNYFHSTTLDRIAAFVNSDGTCSADSPTGNMAPIAEANFTGAPVIPIGTPFELIGAGTDADGDNLTYQWEQIDEDGAGTPTQAFIGSTAANSAIAPLFKSVPPSDNTNRVFPSLSDILNGDNEDQDFEALPQVNRDMNFSLIVRDNQGGISSDGYTVSSSSTAGPFLINSQNTPSTWTADGTATATITWDVANTDNATVNCQNVQILLSTDNGVSFSHEISASTPNDGSHTFTIPNLPTSVGRIKIKSVGNIFFDINDASIEITSSCLANGASFTPDTPISADEGDASLDLALTPEYGSVITVFSGTVTSSDIASTVAGESAGGCINFNGNATFADKFTFQVSTSGSYTFNKTSGAFGLAMNLYDGDFIPSSPCANWLAGSFNNDVGSIGNSMTATLNAGIEYTLVMGSFSSSLPSLPASYDINYTGPGDAINGAVAPSGFDYFYVAVNDTDDSIEEISTDLDLTTYAGGNYTVYGLSALASDDFSSYIGGSLSALQNDFLSLTVCGNLSSNSLSVEIIGGATDCPGDFNGDGAISAFDLSSFLGLFQCSSDCGIADLTGDGVVSAIDLSIFLSIFGTTCD